MDEPSEVPEPEAGFSWSRSRLAVFGSLAAISLGSVVGVALAIANRRTAPLPPLASGWTRHSVRSQGFSVDLPPGWKAVSTTSPEDAYNELKDENPTLGTLVRSQTGVVSSNLIKL